MSPMIHRVIDAKAPTPSGPSRRDALKALSSSVALIAASCNRPPQQLIPYVKMPERLVPGNIMRFATSVALAGYGRGVLGITHEGRPTKLEGNPLHPASLGGSDVFLEAEVLQLYDPDRSRSPRSRRLPVATWQYFSQDLALASHRARQNSGKGIYLLTGRITSPTVQRQLAQLRASGSNISWHAYEPVSDENARQGAQRAFGQRLIERPDFAAAEIIWCVGADPLGPGPDQPRFSRDYAKVRKPPHMARLYVTESTWSLTGANADQHLALPPHRLYRFMMAVAQEVGLAISDAPALTAEERRFAKALAKDLRTHTSLVRVGEDLPPELHGLGYALNHKLQAPVRYIKPVDEPDGAQAGSLADLADALEAGKVEVLLIAGTNPVYDSGHDFASRLKQAGFSAHLSLYDDETSAHCDWHLPLSHGLEHWTDLRGPDGTAAIAQPLITPLYDTRDLHQLIEMLGGGSKDSYELVKATWSASGAPNTQSWVQMLEEGVVRGTAAVQIPVARPTLPTFTPPPAQNLSFLVRPDPSLFDGRFSNNAWLQECPKPVNFQVWGNAFELSAALAGRLGVRDGDVLRVTAGSVAVEGPALIRQGTADGVIHSTLGYGRTRAGAIANGIGFRIAELADAAQSLPVEVQATGRSQSIYRAHRMSTLQGEPTQLFPQLEIDRYAEIDRVQPDTAQQSFYPDILPEDQYEWAMVIDTNACIGCNACVISCQAENNIAVVGPEQIALGREMHWLRIDAYALGPHTGFQPVPCMQCQKAPCEPVCPVEASVHDDQGLNVQVYNRCIGTRFCEADCPYKVRRFNWLAYTNGQQYANLGEPPVMAQYNPDVTVRGRGVMEKCTYCVQRISRAKHKALESHTEVPAGGVVTACQAACPTQAIHFGNLKDPGADIQPLRAEKRHYTLLRELGTEPRTTYLAKLFNDNPALRSGKHKP